MKKGPASSNAMQYFVLSSVAHKHALQSYVLPLFPITSAFVLYVKPAALFSAMGLKCFLVGRLLFLFSFAILEFES